MPKQLVVLVFVREDCPISGRYAPTIQHISDQHQKDARFYLVFPDKSESPAGIRKYLSDFRYSIPVLRDPDRVLVKQAHAQVTPEAAVFDAKGDSCLSRPHRQSLRIFRTRALRARPRTS